MTRAIPIVGIDRRRVRLPACPDNTVSLQPGFDFRNPRILHLSEAIPPRTSIYEICEQLGGAAARSILG